MKKVYWTKCVSFSSTTFYVKEYSTSEACNGLRNSSRSWSKVSIILSCFNQKWNVSASISTAPTFTLNENLFNDSDIVSCIQMDSWTDFNDTAQGWNAPKHIEETT
jgi:hypothetical protein